MGHFVLDTEAFDCGSRSRRTTRGTLATIAADISKLSLDIADLDTNGHICGTHHGVQSAMSSSYSDTNRSQWKCRSLDDQGSYTLASLDYLRVPLSR